MKWMQRQNKLAVVCAAALAVPMMVSAQKTPDLGKLEYEAKCATCHGAAGKGDGPLRPFLTKSPPDLTTLTQRSGGAFPVQIVWQTIDGRPAKPIGAHGTRDMPVWGREYRMEALDSGDMEKAAPEWYVRGRILALIDYLERLQAAK